MRGFLLGTISGLALATVGLGGASLIAPQPAGNRPPEAPATDLSTDLEPGQAVDPGRGGPAEAATAEGDPWSGAEAAGATDAALADLRAPAGPGALAVEPGGALPLADTAPAAVPDATDPDPALIAPDPAGPAPDVPLAADAPVIATAASPAPQIPAAEARVDLSTAPAERPAPLAPALATPPEAPPGDALALQDLAGAADALPDMRPAALSEAPGAAAPDSPAPQSQSAPLPDLAAAQEPQLDPSAAAGAAADIALPTPGADGPTGPAETSSLPDLAAPDAAETPPSLPQAAPDAVPQPAPDTAPDTVPEDPGPAPGPAPGPDPVPDATAPVIQVPGTPTVPGLPGGDSGVQVNRPGSVVLPATPPAIADAPPPVAADADPDAPPLVRFAAAVAVPADLPLVSVILIDDGTMVPGPVIVQSIPFAVTVAIDAGRPGAAADMAAYRAAGIEVAALIALPQGAGPTDLDVNLQATFATLPETVALIDPGQGGISTDRDLTQATLDRLVRDGRGFVWMSGGLDQIGRMAADAGAAAVPILRDLDSNDQSAATIRRFIDNAAFRARQDGAVVLLARLRPETISALSLWANANRNGQVALAPLSAVLLRSQPPAN